MGYNDRIDRSNANSRKAREIPEHVVQEIIKETVEASVALQLCKVAPMPAYQERMRVLSAFAGASWLGGSTQDVKDTAKKQTTSVLWNNVYLNPEELAVLVVVPDAWAADSDIAWQEIKDEIRRAFAEAIDLAIFFGESTDGSLPATFGAGLYAGAVAAGNSILTGAIDGTNTTGHYLDIADAIAGLGGIMAGQGYSPTGIATGPTFNWKLARLRDKNNVPLIDRDFSGPTGQGVYGMDLAQVKNGAWDETKADVLLADFDNVRIGIRQDMTFSVSDSATILGADFASSYSAFQQDGQILRAVMRLGYAVPNPVKKLGGTYPVGVIRTTGGPAS